MDAVPTSTLGQLYTFAIEADEDQNLGGYIFVPVLKGDTVAKIASRRGHPEDARKIADLNGVRSTTQALKLTRLKVPGVLKASASFNVLAGDTAPTISDGYAKFQTQDRRQRVGLTVFTGYNPLAMTVPVRFENVLDGQGAGIEDDIRLLERMAGRGAFVGAAQGQPPVVRVSTTDGQGRVVPLIPSTYQFSAQNPSAPLWRVSGVAWSNAVDDPLRNSAGNRIRQTAVVTLQEHVKISLITRSAAARAKAKAKPKPKPKPK